MTFEVLLTASAEADIEEIWRYVASHDGPAAAESLLDSFDEVFESLEILPSRGRVPAELAEVGIREFREVISTPFRIIYATEGERVLIYAIADGRRDMRDLLERRLLS